MFIYRLVATIEDTEVISKNNKSYFIITIYIYIYFIVSVHQIVLVGVGSETALILLGN